MLQDQLGNDQWILFLDNMSNDCVRYMANQTRLLNESIAWDARFGWHSLIAAYGISPDKVVFIPHGVDLPKNSAASTRHLTAHIGSNGSTRVRGLLAKAGKILHSVVLLVSTM